MTFQSIVVSGWRQFDQISLDFHDHVTVLVGANGSGKTALMRLLARMTGWYYEELSTPQYDKIQGVIQYLVEIMGDRHSLDKFDWDVLARPSLRDDYLANMPPREREHQEFYRHKHLEHLRAEYWNIGRISWEVEEEPYSGESQIFVSKQATSAVYELQLHDHRLIDGIFVPAHRAEFGYSALTSMPLQSRPPSELSNEYSEYMKSRSRYAGGISAPPNLHIKGTLLSWAVLGFGNSVVPSDVERIRFFEGFGEVLRAVLPTSLGFERLVVRPPEVVLVCRTGEFMIDASSGGISAIIDIAWQVYIHDPSRKLKFTVLIDEIENHLHASMQRTILPSLVEAFPYVQFIVATHSPLVIGSMHDCSVFALQYGDNGKVSSVPITLEDRVGTASDILRNALDVPVTIPEWAELELRRLSLEYAQETMADETLDRLREELERIGLREFAPDAISRVLGSWMEKQG